MYPKFILVTGPKEETGTFRYGMVYNHKDLIIGYEKVHGGGWFLKDDNKKTMTLYGYSVDFGKPNLLFLDRIPKELKEYSFWYTVDIALPPNPLDTSAVEWI
ncbi:MAG: hypothetical protein MJZ16_07760 [Bacteroidales bacterium]|nr:hypothetical protein [Bacteroidales bacterium]